MADLTRLTPLAETVSGLTKRAHRQNQILDRLGDKGSTKADLALTIDQLATVAFDLMLFAYSMKAEFEEFEPVPVNQPALADKIAELEEQIADENDPERQKAVQGGIDMMIAIQHELFS